MMPEVFRVYGLPIHGYGLMIVLGFLLSAALASRAARRRGLPDVVYDLGVVMLLSGLVGGRLFYYIQFYRENFAHQPFHKIFAIWEGGLVFYGGALGGALGGFLFLRLRRVPVAELLDTIAPFVPIGMAFGRLGCLMNGCCHGELCTLDVFPLSVRFPSVSRGGAYDLHVAEGLIPPGAGESLPVLTVQLYEAAIDVALCPALLWLLPRGTPKGAGIPLLFVLYAVARFFMEYLRGDHGAAKTTVTGLSFYQNVSILLAVGSAAVVAVLWWREGRRPPVRPGSPSGFTDGDDITLSIKNSYAETMEPSKDT